MPFFRTIEFILVEEKHNKQRDRFQNVGLASCCVRSHEIPSKIVRRPLTVQDLNLPLPSHSKGQNWFQSTPTE